MLYQLAEIIGASKIFPGTLGHCALVVDAAPCDASAMSEGLLPSFRRMNVPRGASRCDQDSFATMTGWRLYGEGERDVDELVAAAIEAIEEDVTDYDMCTDLIENDPRGL